MPFLEQFEEIFMIYSIISSLYIKASYIKILVVSLSLVNCLLKPLQVVFGTFVSCETSLVLELSFVYFINLDFVIYYSFEDSYEGGLHCEASIIFKVFSDF